MTRQRPTLADQQTRGEQELAVLVDGPWAHRWYWRDELEAMQQASRRMGHPDNHPAAVLRCYRPAGESRPHPTESNVSGQAWRYHRPTQDREANDLGVEFVRAPRRNDRAPVARAAR